MGCTESKSTSAKAAPSRPKPREHKNENEVKSKYKFGKKLGTGAFSTVRLVVEKQTGTEYACKMMEVPLAGQLTESGLTREDIFLEINILCELDHGNVIKFKEYFEEDSKVFIICELLLGGELLNALINKGSYTETDSRLIFVQIIRGVEYIHANNVVHRDLKMENLLLAQRGELSQIKIVDFGMAKKPVVNKGMQTICGSPQYVAPEILLSHTKEGRKTGGYGPEVDMWSTGVILYSLLLGFPPFYDKCEPRMFKKIVQGVIPTDSREWKSISKGAKDIIFKLLATDPKKRMTPAQALKHSWITQTEDKDGELSRPLVHLREESFREPRLSMSPKHPDKDGEYRD